MHVLQRVVPYNRCVTRIFAFLDCCKVFFMNRWDIMVTIMFGLNLARGAICGFCCFLVLRLFEQVNLPVEKLLKRILKGHHVIHPLYLERRAYTYSFIVEIWVQLSEDPLTWLWNEYVVACLVLEQIFEPPELQKSPVRSRLRVSLLPVLPELAVLTSVLWHCSLVSRLVGNFGVRLFIQLGNFGWKIRHYQVWLVLCSQKIAVQYRTKLVALVA